MPDGIWSFHIDLPKAADILELGSLGGWFFIWGKITYKDIFDNDQWTTFRFGKGRKDVDGLGGATGSDIHAIEGNDAT